MIQPIRKFDDPILKKLCAPIEETEDLNWLGDLRDTCFANNGVGLAAPQIGILKRAIFIAYGRSHGLILVNPLLYDPGPEIVLDEEGCLSYPGTYTNVPRNRSVYCQWRALIDIYKIGHSTSRVFSGFEARVLQHEVDHLYGICRVGDAWKAVPA